MVTIEEVRAFLLQFNAKVQVYGILFRDDRGKKREALQRLEITPLQRELIVKNLVEQDYVEGPIIDALNKEGEMWVFGKDVKGREVSFPGQYSKGILCLLLSPSLLRSIR